MTGDAHSREGARQALAPVALGPAARPSVLFINRFFHPDQSATSQLLSDLAFELADDFDICVVTSRLQYDTPQTRLPRREVIGGVSVYRIASTGFGRNGFIGRAVDLGSFYVMAWFALLRLARRGQVIVAKTDPPLLSILVRSVARLRGSVVINWLQDVYPEVATALGVRGLNGPLGTWLTAWRDASIKSAKINVVLGERMASHLQSVGVPVGDIRVIPNWSNDLAITPVAPNENRLRREWGLQEKFVVAYSGNLGRAHEYATMLGAAEALRHDESIVFLMIGGGHQLSGLRIAAEVGGLTNIVFRPYQEASRLAESLSVGDVHWLSLRPELEGLIVPSKAYGILAAGRPILAVTDRDGEIARLVQAYDCGVHIAPGDGAALAAAILDLAADPVRASRLGAAARLAATTSFSRAKAIERWRDVLSRAAPGAAALGI
jgi:colanic acid biosynthesis glycosyl transferase WcaI